MLDEKTEAILETAVALGARAGIDRLISLAGHEGVTTLLELNKASAIRWVVEHAKDLVPDRVVSVEAVAGATATGTATFEEG